MIRVGYVYGMHPFLHPFFFHFSFHPFLALSPDFGWEHFRKRGQSIIQSISQSISQFSLVCHIPSKGAYGSRKTMCFAAAGCKAGTRYGPYYGRREIHFGTCLTIANPSRVLLWWWWWCSSSVSDVVIFLTCIPSCVSHDTLIQKKKWGVGGQRGGSIEERMNYGVFHMRTSIKVW